MNLNLQINACHPERLESFLNGELQGEEEREFTGHLNVCENCRRSLEQQAADPEAWTEAENLLKPSKFDGFGVDEVSGLTAVQQSKRQPLQIQNVLAALGPTDDPEMLGRLGGYEVSGVVGAGGMGVVLKAIDKSLDRTVAIKVLAPHLATSGAARKRFAREAKAAAAVLHPNVIAIHSVSNDESLPYLVMPYVRGTSLQKRLDREGPLALQEILRIGAQIAAGLAAAHAQGLVHRDIKPANILLEDGVERVTITDFGLARAVDDATITHSGVIAGTPQYMSPEQARGEAVDGRSDLFSLGSVLYAICAGRPPFRAETTYGVMRRITDDEPTPIREVNSEIPGWLCLIIAKLMSKPAVDRFASAAEVSELFEKCLAHVQQPAAVPLPAFLLPPPNKSRFSFISRRSLGVFTMIAALGLGFLGMFLWQSSEAPDIGGKWAGEEWGDVVLEKQEPGEYEGTYTDTFKNKPGTIQLKWSRLERRFNGTWREDDVRFGKISVRLVDDEIRGAWTTNKKSDINPGTPKLADLLWKRSNRPTEPAVIPRDSLAKGDELRFTKTQELVLSMDSLKFMLDLDTGKTMDSPANIRPEQKQMDIHPNQIQPYHYPTALSGVGLEGREVKSSDWTASAADVCRALAGDAVEPLTHMDLGPEKNPTYYFKTRDSTYGVLQLLELVDEPKGIRLRYKTVETVSATARNWIEMFQGKADDSPAYGQMLGDLQLGVQIKGDQRKFLIGDELKFEYVIKNVGERQVQFEYEPLHPSGHAPRIRNERGQPESITGVVTTFSRPTNSVTLHPGEIHRIPYSVFLGKRTEGSLVPPWEFPTPGQYALDGSLGIEVLSPESPDKKIVASLTTGVVAFEVVAEPADDSQPNEPKISSKSDSAGPIQEGDTFVVEIHSGRGVKQQELSKLVASLNALPGVKVNIHEGGDGDAIKAAFVRDPTNGGKQDAVQSRKLFSLRAAIGDALRANKVKSIRWIQANGKLQDGPGPRTVPTERTAINPKITLSSTEKSVALVQESEYQRFEGTWRISLRTIDQAVELREFGKDGKHVIKDRQMGDARISLDPSKTPREIDLTYTEGPNKGNVLHGIYEWVDDAKGEKFVRVSFSTNLSKPGEGAANRPKDFEERARVDFAIWEQTVAGDAQGGVSRDPIGSTGAVELPKDEAKQIVEQMRGISMQLAPGPRSDGKPDPKEERKQEIIDQLRQLGGKAVPALVLALGDSDVQMRRNAELVMIHLAGPYDSKPRIDIKEALPALLKATEDPDADVRAWAAHAIAEIGPGAKEAIPALIKLLQGQSEGGRNTSCMALGAIGPEAKDALPALRKALDDPSKDVRQFAQAAIKRIELAAGEKIPQKEKPATDPYDAASPKQLYHFPIGSNVSSLAYSEDGKLFAIANGNTSFPVPEGWKRVVEIRDADTGKTVVSLQLSTPEEDAILAATEGLPHLEAGPLAFSPDGTLLAVGTGLGQVKLFNSRTGELVLSLDDEQAKLAEKETPEKLKSLKRAMGGVGSLVFSPDGSLLAMSGSSFEDAARNWGGQRRLGRLATGAGRLKIWEVKTGMLKQDLAGFSHANMVAFSHDGNLLACAGLWLTNSDHGTGVIVWNPQTGEKLRTITQEANGGTHAIAFSPVKNQLVIGARIFDRENDTSTTTISLAYPLSGITEWQRTFPGWANPKSFSPDGKSVVALCGSESIQFLETETGNVQQEIKCADYIPAKPRQGGQWNDFAISPKSLRLAIAGVDKERKGSIEIWNFPGRATP